MNLYKTSLVTSKLFVLPNVKTSVPQLEILGKLNSGKSIPVNAFVTTEPLKKLIQSVQTVSVPHSQI